MAQYKASENQNLLDIAIQKLGSVSAAFDLAVKNGLSITDNLTPGQKLISIPVNNADLADYLWRKKIVFATSDTQLALEYGRIFSDEFGEEFA